MEGRTRLILAEENARIQYLAAAVGTPLALRADEHARIRKHTASAKAIRKSWHYEEATARRRGDLDGL